MRRSALELASAWASVLATTNSTPLRPEAIMLLTALPPAPPTPNTVMRGLSSVRSGTPRLMLMAVFRSFIVLYSAREPRFVTRRVAEPFRLSKIVPYPLADPGEITGAGAEQRLLDCARMPVVAPRPIEQEADDGGEIGRRSRGRQTAQGARAAQANRPSEHIRREFRQTRELACAAGQHEMLGDFRGNAACGKPPAQKIERLLDARANDAGELRLGNLVQARLAGDGGVGDDFALVGQGGERGPVQRLESFGVVERRRQRAGDIGSDAVAAKGDGVGMNELAIGENRERRRAGAEIDAGDAELRLVGRRDGERARIGRGDEVRHAEMAALDA